MSGSIGEVVARLLAARERLDAAAVTANRAKADADQAVACYSEAAQGSDDSMLASAIADAKIAGAKSDRVARILTEICGHIVDYVNHIAPGAAPAGQRTIDVSGERLVTEAQERGSRLDRFARQHVKKADSVEENLQKAEKTVQAGKEVLKLYKTKPGAGNATTLVPDHPPVDGPAVEHPITAVVIAAGTAAVMFREAWKKYRERHGRR